MTAVEYLINIIDQTDWINYTTEERLEVFNQAKEMEKKQHYETWFESTAKFSNEAEMLYKKDFEQYYTETFNK